jgi:hypothetical protein
MIVLPFVLKKHNDCCIDCANFDGSLSPYHINKLMLSLYLRKDKSENSSVENF